MFKVNNRLNWRRSGIFIVDFEHISHLVLEFLLLTLTRNYWDIDGALMHVHVGCFCL